MYLLLHKRTYLKMNYKDNRSYIKKFNIFHQNLIQIITNNGNFILAETIEIIVKFKEINA